MDGKIDERPIAAVVFDGPHGRDGVTLLRSEGRLLFGRAETCHARFAYAPDADLEVPRVAGAIAVAGDRVVVHCAESGNVRPLIVKGVGQPLREVRAGEVFGSAAQEFTVEVRGEAVWTLLVRTRSWDRVGSHDAHGRDEVTLVPAFDLSERDRQMLNLYAAPIRAGGVDPATHKEVAEVIGIGESTVRIALYDVWSRMVSAGMYVPAYKDKRMGAAHAAIAQRIE